MNIQVKSKEMKKKKLKTLMKQKRREISQFERRMEAKRDSIKSEPLLAYKTLVFRQNRRFNLQKCPALEVSWVDLECFYALL